MWHKTGFAITLLASVAVAGCGEANGNGPGGPEPGDASVDLLSAHCARVAETRGEGYAGAYTEYTWNFTAEGTAGGDVEAYLTVSVEPVLHSHTPWHGDLAYSGAAWHSEPVRILKRLPGDPPQTQWVVQGITDSHTDYDGLGDDDNRPWTYTVTAAVGESGGPFARDSATVDCT